MGRSGQEPILPIQPVSEFLRDEKRRLNYLDSVTRLHMPSMYPMYDSYVELSHEHGEERARRELAEWLILIGFERNYKNEHIERAHLFPLVVVDEVIWRMTKQINTKGPIENGIGWFLSVAKTVAARMVARDRGLLGD